MEQPTNTGNGSIPFGMTFQTSKLIELLSKGKPGDTLTDEQLTECCGRDTRPNAPGYANLASAMKNVLRNHDLVWCRIRGANAIECKGFKGKLAIAEADQRHIHRRTKRTLRVLETVKADEVPEGERSAFNVRLAQAGALAAMSAPSATKQLEARSVTAKVDPARLLAAIVETEQK